MYLGKGIRKWAMHAMPNQEVVMDPPFLYLAFFGSRGNPDFLHPLFYDTHRCHNIKSLYYLFSSYL